MVKISEIKGIERIYAATEDNCTVEFACGYNSALDIDIEVDVEKASELMVKEIARQMEPSVTFDDKAYQELLGTFVPKGIKNLAIALSTSLKEWLRVKGQKGE